MEDNSATLSETQSDSVKAYINSINYMSGLVKTASYLDPYESFTVKGKYAKSWFRLYWLNIIFVILLILGVLAFLGYGTKKLFKYAKEAIPEKTVKKQAETKHHFTIPFLSGLFASIAVVLMWVVSILIIQIGQGVLGSGSREIFALLIILLAILITLAALIGTPIYIGNKYGALMGLLTMLSLLGWLFIFTILAFFVFAFLGGITATRILY